MFTDLLTPLTGVEVASSLATIIWIMIAIVVIIVAWKLYLAFAGGINLLGGRGRDVRLAIIDAAPVDQKRRIVLVRRDGVEHLLMIGGPNDIVIEHGIPSPVTVQTPPATHAPAKKPAAAQAKPAQKSAPIKAAAPAAAATPANADDELLDDIPLEEEDMFDSLIADRVAAAKKQQVATDIPPATVSAPVSESVLTPKPSAAPKAAPAPALAPTQPIAQPVAQPATKPAATPTPKPTAKVASNDVSLEDEMQALIRDLQTK